MNPIPDLPLKAADIGEEITADQIVALAKSFVILVNYVEEQEAKCGNAK